MELKRGKKYVCEGEKGILIYIGDKREFFNTPNALTPYMFIDEEEYVSHYSESFVREFIEYKEVKEFYATYDDKAPPFRAIMDFILGNNRYCSGLFDSLEAAKSYILYDQKIVKLKIEYEDVE